MRVKEEKPAKVSTKEEIKYVLFAIALGMTLTGYAHMTFATKELTQLIMDRLVSIESKLDNYIINSANRP